MWNLKIQVSRLDPPTELRLYVGASIPKDKTKVSQTAPEVQILFLHKKQDDSVITLQRFKLLGLGSVSNIALKQNEIKKEGIASHVFQGRSFFAKSHHLVQ